MASADKKVEFVDEEVAEKPTAAYIAASPSEISARMWQWRIAGIERYVESWQESDGGASGADTVKEFLRDAGELAKLRATGKQPARAFTLYNEWGRTLWGFDEFNRRRENANQHNPDGALTLHIQSMEEVFGSIEMAEYDPAEDPPVMAILAAAVRARDS